MFAGRGSLQLIQQRFGNNWKSFAAVRDMHSSSSSFSPSAAVEPPVLFQRHDSTRTVILNRPGALNALNLQMIRSMTPHLQQLQDPSEECKLVLLKGNGRAFCAGGDVKAVVTLGQQKNPEAAAFFREEYQLNHLIATYKRPIIALMDGITMGGGVGLSVHAPFRIATEKTVFAMPETAIGLFPDVGGSFFLPRLDGQMGKYLALTGDRLKGEQVFWAGIATHFVPSARLPALEQRLNNLNSSDFKVINDAIEEFVSLSPDQGKYDFMPGSSKRQFIDHCFSQLSVESIMEELRRDGSDFALKILEMLGKMSPTSLKVTLRQIRNGEMLGISECFMMEYRMASRAVKAVGIAEKSRDFYTGVDALLISKTGDPKWQPDALDQVTDEDVDWYFSPFDNGEEELSLLSQTTYNAYPYNTGLPWERDIVATYDMLSKRGSKKNVTADTMVNEFNKRAAILGGPVKSGLELKVLAYIKANFSTDDNGHLTPKSKL